jgi:hypothetical protein
MEEVLKIAQNGQWSLEKAKPMTEEEAKIFKEKRDAYLRQKHNLPSKEEHQKQLDASHSRNAHDKTARPDYSHGANKKYKESYHSATRETAPGKFVYQGTPKKPPADVVPPNSSKPEFHGGGFERSPVRMSPKVGKK